MGQSATLRKSAFELRGVAPRLRGLAPRRLSGLTTLWALMSLDKAAPAHLSQVFWMGWCLGNFGAPFFDPKTLPKPIPLDIALHPLNWMVQAAEHVGAGIAGQMVLALRADLRRGPMTHFDYGQRLEKIADTAKHELMRAFVLHVPTERVKRAYEQTGEHGTDWASIPPFGGEVADAFPELSEDIAAALRCWMYGENVACVFHLVRVIEGILQALVKLARIRVKKQWPTWNDYLTPLETKLKPKPRGHGKRPKSLPRKDEVFFAGATSSIRTFSRAWRSPIVHDVNQTLLPGEATMILDQVEAFAQHVAARKLGKR